MDIKEGNRQRGYRDRGVEWWLVEEGGRRMELCDVEKRKVEVLGKKGLNREGEGGRKEKERE